MADRDNGKDYYGHGYNYGCDSAIPYPHPHRTREEIMESMAEMGVRIIQPLTRKEKQMAEAMDAFSSFVLEEEAAKCQQILEKHAHDGSSVGVLQGGSEKHEIYRVLITLDEDEDENEEGSKLKDASSELFEEFHSTYPGLRHVWNKTKLQEYMVTMASAVSSSSKGPANINTSATDAGTKRVRLGNLMFILTFGETDGQVRHIDNMVSNQQICLYMSNDCPSTVIYSLDEPDITNADELLDHWESIYNTIMYAESDTQNMIVNDREFTLLKTLLLQSRDKPLKSKWYTRHCANWGTIDSNLKCFGKLYRPVLFPLSLTLDPGTMLVAGGNDVHAGPPTTKARMFAFAIGIPEDGDRDGDGDASGGEENNGEVQYSPVLFHLDLCTVLFPIMDFEYKCCNDDERDCHHKTQKGAKIFLVKLLISLVKEYPTEPFDRLLGDERAEVREWLLRVVTALLRGEAEGNEKLNNLVEEAVTSETMLYSPDVAKRHAKKKKRRSKNSR